ncbi:sensor histidine kinase [Streptomyces sp. NPDC060205]|uniref:sensor histidine kinase n=1 Tax=Streptomyces sp. NPDC060205 TaxID=3347072 RepID=UPI00365AB9B7
MDTAQTPVADLSLRRSLKSLRYRLLAASPWSRGRVAGEAVLAVALAAAVGTFDGNPGFGARSIAMALTAAVLSLVRRSLPTTVLVLASALAGVLAGATLLLMCVSWSAGSRIVRLWRTLATYAAGLVLNVALSARTAAGEEVTLSPLTTALLSTSAFVALAVLPGLASRYRAQRHALLAALRRHNAQLVREQAMVAREARLLERQRIAQDMHDSLGHQLALIAVHTGALEVDPGLGDRQREGVGILREASRSAMRELREAVGILRDDAEVSGDRGPDPADTHPTARVAAAVDGLVESSRAAGADVALHRSGGVRPLAPAADHAAYRMVQEGLTNAHKHAPGASITVALRYEPDSLVVEVANGPVSTAVPVPAAVSGGHGLPGLRERARLVGGMVHTGVTSEGGFRLAGVLPYSGGETASGARNATSVDGADDFRGQWRGSAGNDDGAIIDRSVQQGELTAIMSSKKNVALGCGVTAVALIVGVIALGAWGLTALWDEFESGTISADTYESVKVGDTERNVKSRLPEGSSVLTEGQDEHGPPLPEDARCSHYLDAEDDLVYRFCFRGGKLVQKETYKDEI